MQSVPTNQILAMRMQSQFFWDTYFSSTRKFVNTVLEILKDRVYSHLSRSYTDWNFPPGALFNQMANLNNNNNNNNNNNSNNNNNMYTAILQLYETTNGFSLLDSISVLIENVDLFELILVTEQKFKLRDPTKIRILSKTDFTHFQSQTNAILNLEFNHIPTPRDVEFGFYLWRQFPIRLVGYSPFSHLWDTNKEQWTLDNNNNNNNNKQFSMVSLAPAFFHKSYLSLFIKNKFTNTISVECQMIAFNLYISHLSRSPPILLHPLSSPPPVLNETELNQCIGSNIELYEYNPLLYSQISLSQIGTKDE